MFLAPIILSCLISPAQLADPAVFTVQHRTFRVPVQIESRRREFEKIALFVSTDYGKTWKEAGVIDPDEESFRYIAPADGLYWFAVQIELKNMTKEPAQLSLLEPALKVNVETPKKPDWQPALAELDEEMKQLRADVKRLKDRITVLERLLKEKP
jgi:hypothetical protein